ncbi:MAG: hypothetical protein KDD60_11205, partial [Bdellovibrionales bacterium]|nr:hypothetical protein [Bdellovibrionales bacterium]
PLERREIIDWTVNSNGVEIRNNGNVNILFDEGKHCNSSGNDCQEIEVRRLHPRNNWHIPVKPGRKLVFHTSSTGEFQNIEIDT